MNMRQIAEAAKALKGDATTGQIDEAHSFIKDSKKFFIGSERKNADIFAWSSDDLEFKFRILCHLREELENADIVAHISFPRCDICNAPVFVRLSEWNKKMFEENSFICPDCK